LSLTELAYNLQLSRNVNFRGEDQTGIYNYKDPDVYINRLSLNEGDEIIEFILSNNIHIPFQTHDLMVNLDVLNCMDLDYKMIELLRNPIDNLYSWWIKGLGERFSNDIREFTLPVEYKGFSFPWYCHGYEEEVIDLNPYERCIKIGINLIERSIDQYKNSKNKDKIIIILFEDMVQNPNYQLNRIEDFLGLQTTKYTNKFISEAKCPRVLNPKDRNDKLSIFKENVSPDLFENLVSLTNSYEKDTYGLV